VARSFGYSSFEEVLAAYESDYGGILTGKKWGWVATLLAAEDGDVLRVGSPVISDLHPYVHYKSAERIWLRDCDEIMIGSRPLLDYTNYVVDTPNPRELPIIWRDTSASYYVLVKNHAPGYVQYVDGSDTTDLPDFHSVDVAVSVGPASWNPSAIVDRFGNMYLTLIGAGIGLSTGGISYTEGYICANASSPECFLRTPSLTDEGQIRNIIAGTCVLAGLAVDWGAALEACATPGSTISGGAVLFSAGVNFGVGVTGTFTFHVKSWTDPLKGWNWAIRDRLNGVTLNDLRTINEAPRPGSER